MRHFSDFEKDLIKLIAEISPNDALVFGDFVKNDLFTSRELALWINPNIKKSVLFVKHESVFKQMLGRLVDVLALISYLEKEGLVYLCKMSKNNSICFFYEDCKNIHEDVENKNKVYFNEHEYISSKPFMRCFIDNKEDPILIGCDAGMELYESLSHVFNSVVYPITSLKKYVENEFESYEERENKRQEKRYKNQRLISWVAIGVAIASPFLSILFGNYFGKTTLNEVQFDKLENIIIETKQHNVVDTIVTSHSSKDKTKTIK